MPRVRRNAPGHLVYQDSIAGMARQTLVHKEANYQAFERQMQDRLPLISGGAAGS